ncbi:SDR family oxidoreductase [Frankia sp. CNm7]|uniref:SDR family oxidoreductase n=1 Tax=Frankia nepalensis TaxID=1836974 RepID=A0A937RMM8_9ACTN|nr:SDR family oxidoreductase [Frankia nepalensis]MBL7502648.1 SDR family oxidoreductase [Frankia nepalensis]MBL7514874.1 SDR family oxidoreductase [Frankia nepalensis]MBL7524627.1 SDR family oxidoreductase [Frankia nepalensis]MBL7633020.1 SDR family oxidoreductase [Frankia nepalensis]
MDLGLAGRRAIVTGGSRGIGRAIAAALLAEGVQVVIAARGEDQLKVATAQLSVDGGVVVPVVTDTGSDESVQNLVARTVSELGGVDILVNNAARVGGPGGPGGVRAVTTEDAAADFNVKVLGYLRAAQEVIPHLVAQKWGRIINVGGLAARQVGLVGGSIRNAGIVALTKTLADELGPHGITVNAVHPGATRTDQHDGTLSLTDEQYAALGGRVAIGRVVTADEVAAVVAFLASPVAAAVTGESIAAGGGTPGPIHY